MVPLPAMSAHRIALRVFATPRFAAVAVIGLAAICMAALDVPQGLGDREVIEGWSHGTGPFVTLLGLNHLARGLLPWALLAVLVAHGVACQIATGTQGPPRADRWTVAGSAALILSLGAFAATASLGAPPDVRDATRLTIEPARDAASGGRQVVEEGATYQLPGPAGDRVVTFGVTSLGPWAAERRADGGVLAHLPLTDASDVQQDVTFRVDARRPLALSGGATSGWTLPASLPAAASVLAALAAAAVLVLAGFRASRLRGTDRWTVVAWLAAAFLGVLVNPLVGPGRGEVPVGAGSLGAPVLNAVLARTPSDVSNWVGSFPALTVLVPLKALVVATAIALLLLLAIRIAAPRHEGLARLATRVAGALAIASGAVLLAWAIGRIPLPDTFTDLATRFERDVLPRLPGSLAVLEAAPTHAAPYVLPVSFGLLAAIGPLAAGVSLVASQGRRASPSRLSVEPLALALAGTALLRAAALAFAPEGFAAPAASVPVAVTSAILAATAVVARRLHPDREAVALAPAVVAAALQLALAA